MNSYRKLATQRNKKRQNKMSKTLKRQYMSKKKQKKIKSNKKFRNRYQIGCSRKNNMKGGGVSPFQAFSDAVNAITTTGNSIVSAYIGTASPTSSNPTDQLTHV